MTYSTEYPSPLGAITLACDEDAVIGLWFNGQRHYGNILPPETERREHPLLREAKRWLDIYFSGREPDSYWLAKAFILLGDVYVKKGDNFQARATWQSVADGYSPAYDGIVGEAKARIARLI